MSEFPRTIGLMYATARQDSEHSAVVLNMVSAESSSGDYIPPQEMYIPQKDIEKLYHWLKEGKDGD